MEGKLNLFSVKEYIINLYNIINFTVHSTLKHVLCFAVSYYAFLDIKNEYSTRMVCVPGPESCGLEF